MFVGKRLNSKPLTIIANLPPGKDSHYKPMTSIANRPPGKIRNLNR